MTKSHTAGPTGRRVADQIAELRQQAGLSRAQLTAKLESAGRPLSGVVIQRIERGDRPVDVDDLIALALALEVDPVRLMFGLGADEIDITPTWRADPTTARLWAQGGDYLGGDTDQARRVRTLAAELHNAITGKGEHGQH